MARNQNAKKPENEVSREVLHKYRHRLIYIRNGREFVKQGDFANATKHYNSYLGIISEYKGVDQKKLSPMHFDKKDELAEMLLISHLYWDLACIYDRTPKLIGEFNHTISQFVKFTIGFRYQIPNASMVKRYVKRFKLVNKAKFEETQKILQVKTKKCYVATYCYGDNHLVTNFYRSLKPGLAETKPGLAFIDFYYSFSPKFVEISNKYSVFGVPFKYFIARPLLWSIMKVIRLFKH